jgi:hypothetical protein
MFRQALSFLGFLLLLSAAFGIISESNRVAFNQTHAFASGFDDAAATQQPSPTPADDEKKRSKINKLNRILFGGGPRPSPTPGPSPSPSTTVTEKKAPRVTLNCPDSINESEPALFSIKVLSDDPEILNQTPDVKWDVLVDNQTFDDRITVRDNGIMSFDPAGLADKKIKVKALVKFQGYEPTLKTCKVKVTGIACEKISVSVTPSIVNKGDSITFTAIVNGSGSYTYAWTVTGGENTGASDTRSITVRATCSSCVVSATVRVMGVRRGCRDTASGKARVH